MKCKAICLLMMISLFYRVEAQKMTANYGVADTAGYSLAYKLLHDKYDEIIAYTTEGYWQSDHISYIFIGVKNEIYFKGTINLKRNKTHTWTNPIIKYKKIKANKGKAIYQLLEKMGLWKIDIDSLNNQIKENPNGSISRLTLNDGTDYKFELINGDRFLVKEAYEPEYFLKELPQYKQRQSFIDTRNVFLKMYNSL